MIRSGATSARGRGWWISTVVVAVTLGGSLIIWRGYTPAYEPLVPSQFATCTFERLPDRAPIGDVFEMVEGTGTYAEIRIVPAESLPPIWDGLAVQPAKDWPVSLWIYPVGGKFSDGYCAATPRYVSAAGGKPKLYLSKGSRYWGYQETGYQGPLPRPKDHPTDPNMIVCWTYVSTMPGHTGDLLYEISIYPNAVEPTGGKPTRYGNREILQRGILRVVPTKRE